MRLCEVPGCGKKHCAKGKCVKHYYQTYEHPPSTRFCEIPGCLRAHVAKGLCGLHYAHRRNGAPRIRGYELVKQEVATRDRTTGCWVWASSRRLDYGAVWNPQRKRTERTHRLAMELDGRNIEGLYVMHAVCDNPPCYNPAHLKVGTSQDNAVDMVTKGRSRHQRKLHQPA